MPTPNKGEKEKEFISRCMGSKESQKSFPDQAQRFAVCKSVYKRSKEKKSKANLDCGDCEPTWEEFETEGYFISPFGII